MLSRRGFVTGLLAVPAIVHAGNLMPIRGVPLLWDDAAIDTVADDILLRAYERYLFVLSDDAAFMATTENGAMSPGSFPEWASYSKDAEAQMLRERSPEFGRSSIPIKPLYPDYWYYNARPY
jgi:hypothetical protein